MAAGGQRKATWLQVLAVISAAVLGIADGFSVPRMVGSMRTVPRHAAAWAPLQSCGHPARGRTGIGRANMCSSEGGGAQEPAKLSRWQRFVASVQEKGPKMIMGGGITREKLQELGLSMLLSYGWVSNCNMAFCLILSWVTFGKTTGLSPLAR